MSWPIVKLGDIATTVTKGTTPTTLGYEFSEDGIPFLRAQNLVDGSVSVEADPLFISIEVNDALTRSKIKPGDILIAIAGTIGRAAIVPETLQSANCNQAVAIVRLNDTLDKRYFLHWLSSADALQQITQSKVTGVISNLSLGQIRELQIPLPPLEEQKRIAGILDQADALRRLRARALEKLNTLGQAVFQEMFGDTPSGHYKSQRLGNLIQDSKIGLVRGAAEQGPNKDVDYLRMDAIGTDGSLNFNNLKRVDASPREREEYSLREGDLLFNTRNSRELVGKTAVFRGSFSGVYNNNIMRIRLEDKLNSDYLDHYLRCKEGISSLDNIKSGTTSVFAIYQKTLFELPIPLPETEQQKAFSQIISSLHHEKNVLAHSLVCAEGLFASLQSAAFQGNL